MNSNSNHPISLIARSLSSDTGCERRDCEECNARGSVERSVMTQRFVYGDGAEAVTLEARVPVWTCAECDEQYTDHEGEIARHEAVCRHLRRPSPGDLRAFRSHNGLTQEQLAEITAFGIASIKRWETGSQIPSASASQHLFLLMQPGGLHSVRNWQRTFAPPSEPVFQTILPERARRAASRFALRPAPAELCEA